jgi:tRNA modification GTPase
MFSDDTIAAISSAIGPAARIVVRMTGPQSLDITSRLCPNELFEAASAKKVTLNFASLNCPAWIYTFRAPASYTGEDLIEFHLPGNPLLAKMFLNHLLSIGTRPAEPGEFTARAYLSGKMDLTAAEGVAATIAAANQEQLDAARQLLAGELANRLTPMMQSLADTLGLVEVGIDFSEEDVTFLLTDELRTRVESADRDLAQLLDDSDRFEELVHEPRIVLIGRPNAGKSTLINALANQPRAVISPIAGTTRDVLSAALDLPHGRIQLIDIAGLDDQPDDSIQEQAQQHAKRAIESAQYVALVQDVTDNRPAPSLPRPADLTIFTKSDLKNRPHTPGEILVSAHNGMGLTELRTALDSLAFGTVRTGARLALNSRHVSAVTQARSALSNLLTHESNIPVEVVAMELREALDALGQVLGNISPDDVLGRIFSRFCIGK